MDASKPPPTPPPVSPYLTVEDSVAAIRFYAEAFGATELMRMPGPDGKKTMHAAILVNGGLVMMSDHFPEMGMDAARPPRALGGTSVTLHLDLPDVDKVWDRAIAAGAKVVMPLGDQFWGDRYGVVQDPFGHQWSLATRKKQLTPDEMAAAMKKEFGG